MANLTFDGVQCFQRGNDRTALRVGLTHMATAMLSDHFVVDCFVIDII
jgi:hypothetical protein